MVLKHNVADNPEVPTAGSVTKPSAPFQRYLHAPPPRAARRMAALRQALRLPRTLFGIYKIVKQDCQIAALDENLWALWGFHQQSADPHYRARLWTKVRLSAIEPRNVAGLSVWEMAFMMNVAMEIEEPILEYTHQNGEGFRFLLPSLARFMGKNREEAAYAAQHHLPWCESPWCAEERRHANTFARMIERLTKTSPDRENPNQPMIVTPDEEDAVRLVISREAAEWNSSSTYIVMAAHATRDLHNLIRNVARDEIKHLSILSGADSYLFGPRPWKRFVDLVKKGLSEYRGHSKNRSGGDLLGTNAVSSLEVIVSHLLTERYIRKWLKTVPFVTLASIFETCSNQPELAALAPPPERQAQLDETLRKGHEKRLSLVRWEPGPRRKALEQQGFEETNAGIIAEAATKLDGFRGAEEHGSRGDKTLRRRIKKLSSGMLRACLLNRLRDYQIRNNRHVLAPESR